MHRKPFRIAAALLALTCVLALPGCQHPEDSTPAENSAEAAALAEVPDVIGMDIRWAETECAQAGLTVKKTAVPSDAEPYQVLSQSIAPGEQAKAGTVIELTYAQRPDTPAS